MCLEPWEWPPSEMQEWLLSHRSPSPRLQLDPSHMMPKWLTITKTQEMLGPSLRMTIPLVQDSLAHQPAETWWSYRSKCQKMERSLRRQFSKPSAVDLQLHPAATPPSFSKTWALRTLSTSRILISLPIWNYLQWSSIVPCSQRMPSRLLWRITRPRNKHEVTEINSINIT